MRGWGAECGSWENEEADSVPFISYDYLKPCVGPGQSSRPSLQMADKMAETETWAFEAVAYLDAEVPSVHIVAKEQIAGAAGGSAHLEKLHQIKELAVDVSTHWTHKHKLVYACVSDIKGYSTFYSFLTFSNCGSVTVHVGLSQNKVCVFSW